MYVEGSHRTFTAAEDIPAYTAVKTDANGKLVNATAATDIVLGTINAAVLSGHDIDVRLRSAAGTLHIKCGEPVAKDAPVVSDANGLATDTIATGNQIIGYALKAGAAGDVIELLPSVAKH